jgi:hypothetical protein
MRHNRRTDSIPSSRGCDNLPLYGGNANATINTLDEPSGWPFAAQRRHTRQDFEVELQLPSQF